MKYKNLNIGDVIKINNIYYVIANIERNIKCFILNIDNNNPLIKIGDCNYGIKSVFYKQIDDSQNLNVVGNISKETILNIINEKYRTAKVGDIIHFDKDFFYVCEENDKSFNCFKVLYNSKNASKNNKIVGNNRTYQSVIYEINNIDYFEKYIIFDKVSDEEIKRIKERRDNFLFFSYKGMDPTLPISNHWVVKSKSKFDNRKYIVLKRMQNLLLLIGLEDANNMYFDNICIKSITQYIPLYKLGDHSYSKLFGDTILSIPKDNGKNKEKVKAYQKYLSVLNEMKNYVK